MQIELEISDDIHEMIALLNDSPGKTKKAVDRSLRKLSGWVERSVLREFSAKLKITQKTAKIFKRVKVYLFKGIGKADSGLIVWVGTYDIGAHRLGKTVQTKAGVRTGKHFWDGAFLMQPLNAPKPLVFKRREGWTHKYQRSKVSGRMM